MNQLFIPPLLEFILKIKIKSEFIKFKHSKSRNRKILKESFTCPSCISSQLCRFYKEIWNLEESVTYIFSVLGWRIQLFSSKWFDVSLTFIPIIFLWIGKWKKKVSHFHNTKFYDELLYEFPHLPYVLPLGINFSKV